MNLDRHEHGLSQNFPLRANNIRRISVSIFCFLAKIKSDITPTYLWLRAEK